MFLLLVKPEPDGFVPVRLSEPAVLVLVEEVVVLVVVVEGCDEHNDFTPPETFNVTGALCRFERFIPANAFMTVGKRLRPEVFSV